MVVQRVVKAMPFRSCRRSAFRIRGRSIDWYPMGKRSMNPLSIAILHYAGPPTIGGVDATIAAHARVMPAV